MIDRIRFSFGGPGLNPRFPRRIMPFALAVLLVTPGLAGAAPSTNPSAAAMVPAPEAAPDTARSLVDRRDWILAGLGAAASVTGEFILSPRVEDVPPTGLDRSGIALGWDRRALGRPATGAVSSADAFLTGSLVYPEAVVLALNSGRGFWPDESEVVRNHMEAGLLASGVTLVLKNAISRPRPYTYLPADERPGGTTYQVGAEDAFRSFPSGHATAAWASAMTGVGFLATRRPDLPWPLHVAAGALGGGLATATSILRVDSEVHFPSDVAAGTAIGGASGLAITLLHQGPAPAGADRGLAWRAEIAGVALGVVLAWLLTPPTSPWVD
jgi:membrane-associated phospholipid phosphatase